MVFFANGDLGANGFSTGLARFKPGAQLPYHTARMRRIDHGSAGTMRGCGGRTNLSISHRMIPFTSQRVSAHGMKSLEPSSDLLAHVAFSSATVTREFVTTAVYAERDLRDAAASRRIRSAVEIFQGRRV